MGPGDKILTDDTVIGGYSAVNESMLTRESFDVAKSKGDKVYGCTMNKHGALLIQKTAVGDESIVLQIVSMVNDAQTAHGPIETTADLISAWFVPAVIFLTDFGIHSLIGMPELGGLPEAMVFRRMNSSLSFSQQRRW